MNPAHSVHAVVAEDGTLPLNGLPYPAGTGVEVVVRPVAALRDSVLRYDGPFEPAALESDWDALTRAAGRVIPSAGPRH